MSMGVSSGWYRAVQPHISARHLSRDTFIATVMDDEVHILTRKVSRMIHRTLFNAHNISPLRLTLLSTVLLDELITGFPVLLLVPNLEKSFVLKLIDFANRGKEQQCACSHNSKHTYQDGESQTDQSTKYTGK